MGASRARHIVATPRARRRDPVSHRALFRAWGHRDQDRAFDHLSRLHAGGYVIEDEIARSAELSDKLTSAEIRELLGPTRELASAALERGKPDLYRA